MREAGAPEATAQAERGLIPLSGLVPRPNPADALLKLSSHEILAEADRWLALEGTPEVADVRGKAGEALGQLKNVVLSQQHQRLALALSCAVMVLTGAMTALLLSRRLPLTVYLFTFFPAVASMVTISGGQQVTASQGPAGLLLMWSGVGGLALYSLIVFRVLARH